MMPKLRASKRAVYFLTLALTLAPVAASSALAQAGFREALLRLDRNENGEIEPDEITPLARPYLERIAEARRLSLERSNDIEKLQEAARIYHALRNGVAGQDIKPQLKVTVLPFGPAPGEPLIPEFGLPVVKYPYTKEDLDQAQRILRRYDRNEDGFVDRDEAARSRWTHRNPFEMDLDKDNRLSRLELAQRYARRRMLSGDAGELAQKARRERSASSLSDRDRDSRERRSDWWRSSRGNTVLAVSLLRRFDADRNWRLTGDELKDLGLPVEQIDRDQDGEIAGEELNQYLNELLDAQQSAAELPEWFHQRDTNGDGQVAMSEFTREWDEESLRQFTGLDRDGDGLLTISEVLQARDATGGVYQNTRAEPLAPRRTIISEIEVSDDFVVGDLNVQISITHTHTSHLDGFLTGPDGQQIELFTEVGESGDHFAETIFDDQARTPINRARAPFEGSYLPEGLVKRQPGLSHYNGKSIKGVWQLVIRAPRSDRFGMLHRWALLAKPQLLSDKSPTDTPPADTSPGGTSKAQGGADSDNPRVRSSN